MKVRFVDFEIVGKFYEYQFTYGGSLVDGAEYVEFDEALQRIHPDAAVFWDRDVMSVIDTVEYVLRFHPTRSPSNHGVVQIQLREYYVFTRQLKWDFISW